MTDLAASPVEFDSRVDDEELTRLALEGDPDAPLPADSVPWTGLPDDFDPLLPDWYMGTPMPGHRHLTGWRRGMAWLLIISSLLVVASGLCNTYGYLEIA